MEKNVKMLLFINKYVVLYIGYHVSITLIKTTNLLALKIHLLVMNFETQSLKKNFFCSIRIFALI